MNAKSYWRRKGDGLSFWAIAFTLLAFVVAALVKSYRG